MFNISLAIETVDATYFVTCDEFPLLNLMLTDAASVEIKRKVLPVLKEMVEFKVGGTVELRLIETFRDKTDESLIAPHVIASRQVAHIG